MTYQNTQKLSPETKTFGEVLEKNRRPKDYETTPQDFMRAHSLHLSNHHRSVIVLGDSHFKDELIEELKSAQMVPKCVDNIEFIEKHFDGSEVGIIVLSETENRSKKRLLSDLNLVRRRHEIPVVSVLPDYTPIGMEQDFYKNGIQMILEWPRERQLIKGLIIGLFLAGPLETRSPETDESLEKAVKNRMRAHRGFFRNYLVPTIYNGILMLRGTVESVWKKRKVKEVAESIPGVKGATVASVKVQPKVRLSDSFLQKEVRAAILAKYRPAYDTLDVKIKNGEVNLSGTLPSKKKLRAIEHEISKTMGIRAIQSNVDIDPMLHAGDRKLSQLVKSRIGKLSPNWENVQIAVHHGKVIIRGMVKSMFKATQLENAAMTVSGVRQVNNHIKVQAV